MTADMSAVVARLGGDSFLAQAFGRTFQYAPGHADTVADLLNWDDLNEILARHRLEVPRLRLSTDGVTVPQESCTSPFVSRRSMWNRLHPAALHDQLARGATLVIDAIEELHPAAHRLADELAAWLRTAVQANLYASWTGVEGFGTHWDDHDVVVVQLDGAKRWKLYGPTRTSPMHQDVAEPDPPPDQPTAEFVLTAGDMLYLPRGWWHSVSASEGVRSLHLTFGLTTVTGSDLVTWLSEILRHPPYVAWQASLSRAMLGRTPDITFVHNPEHDSRDRDALDGRILGAFRALEECCDQGFATAYGVATWSALHDGTLTVERLVGLAHKAGGADHRLRAIQLPLSLVRLGPLAEALDGHGVLVDAQAAGLDIHASAPLHAGELTGIITPAVADQLRPGATPLQLILATVASTPGVTRILLSASTGQHWSEAMQAIPQQPLGRAALRRITDAFST